MSHPPRPDLLTTPEVATVVPRSGAVGRLLPRLGLGLVLAVVVLSALVLFAETRDLGAALRGFDWWLAPPALALTLWNYGLRFLKWQFYLGRIGVRGMRWPTSLVVFLSAFSMSVTPGKVGEVIKAVHLRRLAGTPVSQTTAVIAAERITDGLAMLLLASAGAVQFAFGCGLLAAVSAVAGVALLLLRRPGRLRALVERLPALPVIGRPAAHADAFLGVTGSLLAPRPLATATAFGAVAWLGECGALFLVLVGLDQQPSFRLFLVAMFVLAVSTLAGAVSLVPGGLGVAEASVAGMLLALLADDGITRGTAAAATLLIRFGTLWFAVLLGIVALALVRRLGPDATAAARPEGGER